MTAERFKRLTDGQLDCLRLILRHYQIKEIARALDISASTVNQRLDRARTILGASTSVAAARIVAEHEGWPEMWIPAAQSQNPLPFSPDPASTEFATTGIEPDDATLLNHGDGMPGTSVRAEPQAASVRWPFSTAGRRDNDLSTLARMAWVLPVAILSLILLMTIALLSLGLQDMLVGFQSVLGRLI